MMGVARRRRPRGPSLAPSTGTTVEAPRRPPRVALVRLLPVLLALGTQGVGGFRATAPAASVRVPMTSKGVSAAFHGRSVSTPGPPPARRFAAATTMQTTASSTVLLPYTEFGAIADDAAASSSSSLPPVLLLHGLLGNRKNFATVGTSLAQQLAAANPQRRRRVLAVDLRNHGEAAAAVSDPDDLPMEYAAMAADVVAFLDHHRLPSAVLVGHSMGGKVAQACALLAPDRVAGLVVLDIAPVPYCPAADPHWRAVHDIVEALCGAPVGPGVARAAVDQHLRAAIPDPALRAFVLTNLDSKKDGCRWKIPLDAIARQLDRLAAFDLPADRPYGGDAFFVHGGQSRFVSSRHLPRIAAYFPNHLLTTVKGAGHWLHAEAPDDTTALLRKYLER